MPLKYKDLDIIGLDPETTILLNGDGDPLPNPNFKDKYIEGENLYNNVKLSKLLGLGALVEKKKEEGKEVKAIVVDTWTRICTNTVDSPQFSGQSGYDKWKTFAVDNVQIFTIIKELLPEDCIVYMLAHPETATDENGRPSMKVATEGNLLDKRGGVESFSNIVVFTQKVQVPGQSDQYSFRVNNYATTKTPIGMFEEENIPNDLGLLDRAIRAHYQI